MHFIRPKRTSVTAILADFAKTNKNNVMKTKMRKTFRCLKSLSLLLSDKCDNLYIHDKNRVLSLHSKRFGELAWKRLKIREDQAGDTENLYITSLKDYFTLKINSVANVNETRFRLSQAGVFIPKSYNS